MTDFGVVIKRNNDDFVVKVNLDSIGSGYNVVPKEVDPYNSYDIEEVRAYCLANPDKVFDDYNPAPEPQPEPPTPFDKIEAQVVYTAMMTDTLIEE